MSRFSLLRFVPSAAPHARARCCPEQPLEAMLPLSLENNFFSVHRFLSFLIFFQAVSALYLLSFPPRVLFRRVQLSVCYGRFTPTVVSLFVPLAFLFPFCGRTCEGPHWSFRKHCASCLATPRVSLPRCSRSPLRVSEFRPFPTRSYSPNGLILPSWCGRCIGLLSFSTDSD